jgi:hypothetical protein
VHLLFGEVHVHSPRRMNMHFRQNRTSKNQCRLTCSYKFHQRTEPITVNINPTHWLTTLKLTAYMCWVVSPNAPLYRTTRHTHTMVITLIAALHYDFSAAHLLLWQWISRYERCDLHCTALADMKDVHCCALTDMNDVHCSAVQSEPGNR